MTIDKQGYIACAHFEETIRHFGESDTPDKALSEFLDSGTFAEYCDCRKIEKGTNVVVKVFKAIYEDSPEADLENWEYGWQWMLGEEVSKHEVKYIG